jgi:di/tricarboxylate transporter
MQLYITIAIIFIGVFLFVKDYFTIDTTSILIMALFIVSGVLNPEEGFSGFNHPATLTLGCMFVVSAAVFKSGLIDGLSGKIVRIAKIHYLIALIVFCLISAFFSAFINDTAVVAILIPLALSVCRDTGIAPSKLLIPISFSALFGGTCTLIGTSTNILVSGIAEKSGLEPFGMFEFSMPALCLLGIGLTYMFVVAPFILPNRKSINEGTLLNNEGYTAELILTENSKDIGKTIHNSDLTNSYAVKIITIIRNGENLTVFDRDTVLEDNDVIKIIVEPEKLNRIKESKQYAISGNKENLMDSVDNRLLYETLVPIGSSLAGTSLKKNRFRNIYNCSVLAIRHRNETIKKDLSEIIIKEGDMLLIYASREELNEIIQKKIVIVLSEYKETKLNLKKAIPALFIALGVVTTAALGITSILISAMVGCLLLVTTSILKPKEAYDAIEWKVIFMMAGVLSMGTALEKTGGALLISNFVFETFGNLDPRITLSLVFLTCFLSTNVISSKATAALMVPVVIGLSSAMQISEKPMLIAVMFACSLTFMTPVSYPVNTMVYAPGNYKFKDFLKVGTPLNIIIWIAASLIIPLFFPF